MFELVVDQINALNEFLSTCVAKKTAPQLVKIALLLEKGSLYFIDSFDLFPDFFHIMHMVLCLYFIKLKGKMNWYMRLL